MMAPGREKKTNGFILVKTIDKRISIDICSFKNVAKVVRFLVFGQSYVTSERGEA